MFSREKVEEVVNGLGTDEQVGLWNEYCEDNCYYDDRIEYNDPNELFYSLNPEQVLERVDLEGRYNLGDRYCSIDGWGEYRSFDYVDDGDSPFDLDALVAYIVDHEKTFGYFDEDDVKFTFNHDDFVDCEMDEDDIWNFILDNDIEGVSDEDDEITKADAVKDYLEDLDSDVEEIEAALSGCFSTIRDVEEVISEYMK